MLYRNETPLITIYDLFDVGYYGTFSKSFTYNFLSASDGHFQSSGSNGVLSQEWPIIN